MVRRNFYRFTKNQRSFKNVHGFEKKCILVLPKIKEVKTKFKKENKNEKIKMKMEENVKHKETKLGKKKQKKRRLKTNLR